MSYSIKIFYSSSDINKNSIKYEIFETMINNFIKENNNIKLFDIHNLNKFNDYIQHDKLNIQHNIFNSYLFYNYETDFDLNLQSIMNEILKSQSDIIIHKNDDFHNINNNYNFYGFTIKRDFNLSFKNNIITHGNLYEQVLKYKCEIIENYNESISLNYLTILFNKTLKEVKNKSHINFLNIIFNFSCTSIINIYEYYTSETLLEICEKILKHQIPKIKLYLFKNDISDSNIMINSFYLQKTYINNKKHDTINDIIKYVFDAKNISIFVNNYKINNIILSILLNFLFDKINYDNNIDVIIYDDIYEEIIDLIADKTTNNNDNILLTETFSIDNTNFNHNTDKNSVTQLTNNTNNTNNTLHFSNKYLEVSKNSENSVISNILNDSFDYQYFTISYDKLSSMNYNIAIFKKIKNIKKINILYLQKL
jgi:hypothetical protein